MELEELKAGWNVLNERLAQNEILNKRIIKDMIVTRTNSALSRLKWMNWGGLILVFVMFILVLIMKNIVVIRPACWGGEFLFTVFVISVFWSVWI